MTDDSDNSPAGQPAGGRRRRRRPWWLGQAKYAALGLGVFILVLIVMTPLVGPEAALGAAGAVVSAGVMVGLLLMVYRNG